MNYTIKRNVWGGKIELLRDGHVIGRIDSRGFWSYNASGLLNDNTFTFINKGLFSSRTEILDQHNQLIGDIEYSNWSTRAKIDLNGKMLYWEASNFWATRWRLEDQYGREILLEKNEFIVNYPRSEEDEFLFLLASFLLHRYHRMMVAGAA